MNESYIDFDKHKRIIGILFTVLGILFLVFTFFGTMIATELVQYFVDDPEVAFVSNIIKYAILTFCLLVNIPAIIAGIGLLKHKEWAFTLAFVLGILSIPFFPLWTFVGLYVIIIYLMAHSRKKVASQQ